MKARAAIAILLALTACAPPKRQSIPKAATRATIPPLSYVVRLDGKIVVIEPPASPVSVVLRGDCSLDTELVSIQGLDHHVVIKPFWKAEEDRPSVALMEAIAKTRSAVITLESNGCVGQGGATGILQAISESGPIASSVAFNLRYGPSWHTGAIDLEAPLGLKIVRPLESGRHVAGFRTAEFELTRLDQGGSSLKATGTVDADVRSGTTDSAAALDPIAERLSAAPYKRMLYLTRQSAVDNDLALIGAPSRIELEKAHRDFLANPRQFCAAPMPGAICVAVPREVAARVDTIATVNGKRVRIAAGGTVGDALSAAGISNPEPGRLKIHRIHAGKAIPVLFDPAERAILRLVLMGGESLELVP